MTDATRLRGFESRVVEIKGVRLRYLLAGPPDAAPVVLVHGFGGAASNWVELAPRLAEIRRVVVPELPGHGCSEAFPAPPTLGQFADRIARVLELEGLAPAVAVGHSLGGVVVLRLAARHSELVSGVVLAGAAGIGSSTRRSMYMLRALAILRPGRIVAPFRRRIARDARLRTLVFGHWGAADPAALSPEAAEGLLAGPSVHTDILGAADALSADDPRLDLERVTCPVLIVHGARDAQVPVADAFEYARRLRAPVRVIADCGHLLIAERPDACLDAILALGS
jgi:pimeloyl-ACP methyl ester carboxylesterase